MKQHARKVFRTLVLFGLGCAEPDRLSSPTWRRDAASVPSNKEMFDYQEGFTASGEPGVRLMDARLFLPGLEVNMTQRVTCSWCFPELTIDGEGYFKRAGGYEREIEPDCGGGLDGHG